MSQLAGWHDYFIVVGGGAAALTGLVFVAMTLHLDEIVDDPVHRHRARTILTGLTAVFIRCALALMGGQNGQAIAVELIGVLLVVEFVLYRSIRQAMLSADQAVLLRLLVVSPASSSNRSARSSCSREISGASTSLGSA
jgi:hypothetical protein